MSEAQKRLKQKHGTPEEFQRAIFNCMEINAEEEKAAILKYRKEWEEAGKQP